MNWPISRVVLPRNSNRFDYLEVAPRCLCEVGYVASNGGKFLGEYDTCVKCLPELSCGFDGDSCTMDRECAMGTCSNGNCFAGVSSTAFVCISESVHLALAFINYIYSLFSPYPLMPILMKVV